MPNVGGQCWHSACIGGFAEGGVMKTTKRHVEARTDTGIARNAVARDLQKQAFENCLRGMARVPVSA